MGGNQKGADERERAGLVVINPDRVRRPLQRGHVWHLTGRQLEELQEVSSDEPSPQSQETAA